MLTPTASTFSGVSVVLPVYNGMAYLVENIQSLLNQELLTYEIQISDDGSTDGSKKFLKEIESRQLNNVKVYFQGKNLGLFANLNFLIGKCNYPLIHLWAQDDIMKSACLKEVLDFHNSNNGISMSYHSVDYIDENSCLIANYKHDGTPSVISKELYANICIRWGCITGNIANVTLVQSYLNKHGLFNENLKVSGDFDLFTRLASNTSIGFLNRKLIYLRRHKGQLSRNVSSTHQFILEDIPIYQTLLGMFTGRQRKVVDRFWKWRIQVMYMNQLLYLLLRGHFIYVVKVLALFKKYFNVGGMVLRWIVVRILRFVRRDQWFYKLLESK